MAMISATASSQDETVRYYITVSSNLYLPFSSEKKMFPIVGYDKKLQPSILMGGIGVGFTRWKQLKEKTSLRLHANLTRSAYWEPKLSFRDESNIPLGNYSASSEDYTLGLMGIYHYNLYSRFSVGGGLAAHCMIASRLLLREEVGFQDLKAGGVGMNKFYKPVMPAIPVELSYKGNKAAISIRYEHALLKKYKGDLAELKSDRYGLLFFEAAIKI
jgi:hypothetical protein